MIFDLLPDSSSLLRECIFSITTSPDRICRRNLYVRQNKQGKKLVKLELKI